MSPKPSNLITLTTDFGLADHFVGTMKGVILGITPRARIVDITHAIAPFSIAEACFELTQAWRYFPKGTIHVCIVDPGVGSARRPILVESEGHRFIGPDNGVFSMLYAGIKHKVREVTNPKLMLPQISRTFHGRDIFAPAAAHLARGTPPSRFGKLIRDPCRLESVEPHKLSGQSWRGTILKVDRFGNLITNFHVHQFPDIKTMPIEMRVATHKLHRLALTYADTHLGELGIVVGSSGYIEIVANQASAASITSCSIGAPVELEIG